MFISIDPQGKVPLFEQIADQMRGQIARGELKRGERLPPARTLAEGLEVNMHTVLRAYSVLREEELIELRRGRGAVVSAPARKQAKLLQLAKQLATEAKRQDLSEKDLIRLLREQT
jgi:DNA-binding transcriptional regulator YhcF (GntR family)